MADLVLQAIQLLMQLRCYLLVLLDVLLLLFVILNERIVVLSLVVEALLGYLYAGDEVLLLLALFRIK